MTRWLRPVGAFVVGAVLFTAYPLYGQDLNTLLTKFLTELRAGKITIPDAGTVTLTADQKAISTAHTWNSAGTTFTHWLANVTDTASASGSKLLDLQVGSTTMFNVTKGGTANAGNFNTTGTGGSYFVTSRSGWLSTADGNFRIRNQGGTNTFDLTLDDAKTTLSAESLSMAVDAITYLGAAPLGWMTVTNSEDRENAFFQVQGAANSVSLALGSSSIYSTTKDTASRVNVYYDAAGGSGAGYYMQNKRAATRSLRVTLIGG